MTISGTPFQQFDSDINSDGTSAALDNLAEYLTGQNRLHELFEVKKLQLRDRLGLAIDRWQAIDELPAAQAQQLENGLLEICRDIGTLFFRAGDVASGWQYLEPVGDRELARELLQQAEVTSENVESIIQVSLGHGLDTELGFGLVLEKFGTCSSITTYESQLAGQSLEKRRGPARMLVSHLYAELCGRVAEAIRDAGETVEGTECLRELIAGRDWLFEGLGHHIDTTHLASTVRISRILNDDASISQATELCEYGLKLHDDFQYTGQTPFERIYADTLPYLLALAGTNVEPVVGRLQEIASGHADSGNLDPASWLVYLLDRIGQGQQAIEAYLQFVHEQQAEGIASEDVCPNLMTLVSRYGHHDLAREALEKQGDLLGYASVTALKAGG